MSVFDLSELVQLEGDLASAASRVLPEIQAVTAKGALNVKQQLRQEAQGVAHAPALPAAITYDVRSGSGWFEAQIGPREGGAGSLALLYYGNSKTGPRLPDPVIALEAEGGTYADEIAQVVGNEMLS